MKGSAKSSEILGSHGPNGSNRLAGRVALVSGGAQGIGQAIAALFQREGARVVILDCDRAAGHTTEMQLNAQIPSLPVCFVEADLRHPGQIQEAVTAVQRVHGHLDVLVNNAGVEIDKPLEALTLEDWNRVIEINLRGAFVLTQAAIPLFPDGGGAIVNISSIHASHAFPGSIPYACSKAGMVALTRNLALELAGRRIRANCISPGYIDTRLWEQYLRNSTDPEGVSRQTTDLHPLRRRGMPSDISQAALFLASDSSEFVTGIDLVVDGGLTVRAHP